MLPLLQQILRTALQLPQSRPQYGSDPTLRLSAGSAHRGWEQQRCCGQECPVRAHQDACAEQVPAAGPCHNHGLHQPRQACCHAYDPHGSLSHGASEAEEAQYGANGLAGQQVGGPGQPGRGWPNLKAEAA